MSSSGDKRLPPTSSMRVPIEASYDSGGRFQVAFTFHGERMFHTESCSSSSQIRFTLPETDSVGWALQHYYEVEVQYHMESGEKVFDKARIVFKLYFVKERKAEEERMKKQDKRDKEEDKESRRARKGEGSRLSIWRRK